METKIKLLVGVSAVIIGGIFMLAVMSTTGYATTNVNCGGECSNMNCGAANGGPCDCESCPYADQCETGQCGGSCDVQSCAAKQSGSCGCGR